MCSHSLAHCAAASLCQVQEAARCFVDDGYLFYHQLGLKLEAWHGHPVRSDGHRPLDGILSSFQQAQGDLLRYRHLMESPRLQATTDAMRQAYHLAACLAPDRGAPYNQLGILVGTAPSADPLEAVYCYARAARCAHPFPRASANLAHFLGQLSRRERPRTATCAQRAQYRCDGCELRG